MVPLRGRIVTCSIGGRPGVRAKATALHGAGGTGRQVGSTEREWGGRAQQAGVRSAPAGRRAARLSPPSQNDITALPHEPTTSSPHYPSPPPRAPVHHKRTPTRTHARMHACMPQGMAGRLAHRAASIAAYCRLAADSGRLWCGRPSRTLSMASLRIGRSMTGRPAASRLFLRTFREDVCGEAQAGSGEEAGQAETRLGGMARPA